MRIEKKNNNIKTDGTPPQTCTSSTRRRQDVMQRVTGGNARRGEGGRGCVVAVCSGGCCSVQFEGAYYIAAGTEDDGTVEAVVVGRSR